MPFPAPCRKGSVWPAPGMRAGLWPKRDVGRLPPLGPWETSAQRPLQGRQCRKDNKVYQHDRKQGQAQQRKGQRQGQRARVGADVRALHKRYGDREVLKGVSLTANKGDVITLIGSSGSGKSTFLRCLNLLEAPNAGRITVDGEPLHLVPGRDGMLSDPVPEGLTRQRTPTTPRATWPSLPTTHGESHEHRL